MFTNKMNIFDTNFWHFKIFKCSNFYWSHAWCTLRYMYTYMHVLVYPYICVRAHQYVRAGTASANGNEPTIMVGVDARMRSFSRMVHGTLCNLSMCMHWRSIAHRDSEGYRWYSRLRACFRRRPAILSILIIPPVGIPHAVRFAYYRLTGLFTTALLHTLDSHTTSSLRKTLQQMEFH